MILGCSSVVGLLSNWSWSSASVPWLSSVVRSQLSIDHKLTSFALFKSTKVTIKCSTIPTTHRFEGTLPIARVIFLSVLFHFRLKRGDVLDRVTILDKWKNEPRSRDRHETRTGKTSNGTTSLRHEAAQLTSNNDPQGLHRTRIKRRWGWLCGGPGCVGHYNRLVKLRFPILWLHIRIIHIVNLHDLHFDFCHCCLVVVSYLLTSVKSTNQLFSVTSCNLPCVHPTHSVDHQGIVSVLRVVIENWIRIMLPGAPACYRYIIIYSTMREKLTIRKN